MKGATGNLEKVCCRAVNNSINSLNVPLLHVNKNAVYLTLFLFFQRQALKSITTVISAGVMVWHLMSQDGVSWGHITGQGTQVGSSAAGSYWEPRAESG